MSPLLASAVAAADETPKGFNGGFGLLVVAILAIVVYFLIRSMNKHLRKVAKMTADDEKAAAAASAKARANADADTPARPGARPGRRDDAASKPPGPRARP